MYSAIFLTDKITFDRVKTQSIVVEAHEVFNMVVIDSADKLTVDVRRVKNTLQFSDIDFIPTNRAIIQVPTDPKEAYADVTDYLLLNKIKIVYDAYNMGLIVVEIPRGSFDNFALAIGNAVVIEAIEEDVLFKADLHYAFSYGQHWHLGNIGAQEAWNLMAPYASNGSGPQIASECVFSPEVAILDGGVDFSHVELGRGYRLSGCRIFDDRGSSLIVEDYNWNTFNGNNNIAPATISENHATPIAGIVAANCLNNDYVFSVSGNYLKAQVLKVGDQTSPSILNTTTASIIEGLNRAANNPKCVAISISFGSTGYQSPLVATAIDYTVNQSRGCTGIPIFASAGNLGTTTLPYPASDPNVLAIGASTSSDVKASWSNYGGDVFLLAPGSAVRTIDRTGNNGYIPFSSTGGSADINNTNAGTMLFSGTSASAPIVASIAGCMRAVNPSLTSEQIKNILLDTAAEPSDSGTNLIVRMVPAIEAAIDLISPVEDLTVDVTIANLTPNPGSICSGAPTVVGVSVVGSGATWNQVTGIVLYYYATSSDTFVDSQATLLYSQSFPLLTPPTNNVYTTAFTIPNNTTLLGTSKMFVRALLYGNCGQIISDGATDFLSNPLTYTIGTGNCPGTDLSVQIMSWSYNSNSQRIYQVKYTNTGTVPVTSASIYRGWVGGTYVPQNLSWTGTTGQSAPIQPGQSRTVFITFNSPSPQLPAIYYHQINTVNGSTDFNTTNNYSTIAVNS